MARTVPNSSTLRSGFAHWEKVQDMVDQLIDLQLNHSQSGHPGGSRSKAPVMVALALSGAMRWDLRRPGLPWGDRFVLSAGHVTPVAYALLAVLNEAMRRRHAATGDEKYAIEGGLGRMLVWEDLLNLRRLGGLSGHAEMEGKTLFFKTNTGPSGHGGPAAAGIALALKMAGADDVKVWAVEGEGGLTAGCYHEAKNSAWGLGLSNLHFLIDWNDFGIDDRPFSAVMHGTPDDWFKSYGWESHGAQDGADFGQICDALAANLGAEGDQPRCSWFKTRKGRGYGVFDNKSHGAAHKPNSDLFWETKRPFAEKYGVEFVGAGNPRPESDEAFREQTAANMQAVLSLFDSDPELLEYVSDRLVELGDSVPTTIDGVRVLSGADPATDPEVVGLDSLPDELFFAPGENKPNRAALAKTGAYLNAIGRRKYGRPLVVACSADLADSTNISGFAKDFGDTQGWGWYKRGESEDGALLPQGITEFANAGILCGIASTNMSDRPEQEFAGFWGACSTYGSFSYLKYGPMRLFSQMAQDCDYKLGKVLWIAGHSGPETAEDSRTHFGVFAPGVTQLFPSGQVIDLHPWGPNDVAPTLIAALATDAPIIALHLTRPAVEVPDCDALGMDSYMEAAKGAYIMRDYDSSRPKQGCVIVRGTSSTASLIQLLRDGFFDGDGPNLKLVQAVSRELFDLQDEAWKTRVLPLEDWIDSTVVTNGSRKLMGPWLANSVALEYGCGSDWDDRWRTGGRLNEVIEDAQLDPASIATALTKFAAERDQRLARVRGETPVTA